MKFIVPVLAATLCAVSSSAATSPIPIAQARANAPRELGSSIPVLIEGVVTVPTGVIESDLTDFFLQDATAAIEVRTPARLTLRVGDRVRVAGKVRRLDQMDLEVFDAQVEFLRKDRVVPKRISIHAAFSGHHPDGLIAVRGRVDSVTREATRDSLTLVDGATVYRVYTRYPPGAPGFPADVAQGVEIEAWGVNISYRLQESGAPSYQLRLRRPGDIVILSRPNWWLSPAGQAVAACLVFIVVFVSAGTLSMRRTIRQKTREIQILLEQAQHASRLKSEFLANMSHEIRTPMAGVIGLADDVLAGPLDPDQRRSMELLKESAESLTTILNDILDLSKIESGQLMLSPETFDLVPLAESVLRLETYRANAKGLALHVDFRFPAPAWIEADPVRLRQMLTNLVSNAVKFTEHGSVQLICERVVEDGLLWLRVCVADTGIGIAEEHREQILEPFQQADGSISRRFGGTGLGLAITKRLATAMGGRLWFSTTLGVGSRFCFEIPWRQAQLQTEALASRTPATWAAGRPRILVAEDNPVNQRVAQRLLERFGCAVSVVKSGSEALAAWDSSPYEAILMDVQMPGMDGWEATRQIRRREAPGTRVPIIALTAHAMAGDRETCLQAGMDDYVTKPIDPDALLAALQRCRILVNGPVPTAD